MRFYKLLPILFLAACSHKQVSAGNESEKPLPDPCFTAVAKSDLDYLKKNVLRCKSVKTQSGTTLLMLASAKGRDDVIQFLLEQGIDINERDTAQSTALDYAVVTNQVNSAQLLVLSGIDLESKKSDGITALMTAVQIGSPEMIQTLTTTKQAINSAAEDGWTALYFSIRRKDPAILYWLLRQGACKNVVDSYKQTPIDFAKEVEWPQGIAILQKAPACGVKKAKNEGT